MTDVLRQLEAALGRARPVMDDDAQEEVAAAVLDALFAVGLALSAGTLSRDELQAGLDRTRAQLALIEDGLGNIVYRDPNPLANEIVFPDVYENRSVTRSALQFLIDLYRDGATPPELEEGLDRFDYMLEEAARHGAALDEADIPAAIPREHWWWRAPYVERPER